MLYTKKATNWEIVKVRNKFRKFLEILKSANWKTDTIIIAIFTIIMLGIINFDRVKYWIKEYDFMQLIAGIIAGLITWWAMWFIDLQNSKRWLTEAYAIEEAKSTIEYKLAFEQLFKGSLGSIPDCFIYSPNDFYLKITAIQQLNKRIHTINFFKPGCFLQTAGFFLPFFWRKER